MVNNPDDMGIYNPHIDEWVEIVHDAGGLCFYDHANFNGVMGKIRARELGFDACMYMLHKTFGAPKGGGGPAVGAYRLHRRAGAVPAGAGGRARRRPLPARPRPARLRRQGARVLGQRAAGREGLRVVRGRWAPRGSTRPSDLSVLANNYMEKRLLEIRGDHALAPAARRARGWR